MGKEEILKRMQQNSVTAEEMIKFVEQRLPLVHDSIYERKTKELATLILDTNKRLKSELEFWKKKVIDLEVMNGIDQYSLPCTDKNVNEIVSCVPTKSEEVSNNSKTVASDSKVETAKEEGKEIKRQVKKESAKEDKKDKSKKAPKPEKQSAADESKEIDVSRLDLRIGRILSAKKHPDAESLYVEEIDVGEDKPRTVVSGLVKYVPIEEMQNRLVVVLCNLKPAKMRGVTSEAMVMCASTPEKVEILCPPADSSPGDRVICDEYPGDPDALLPPKKKIFEQVAPDLKTNNECLATYKSSPLKVAGKGIIKSSTLIGVQIK